MSNQIYLRLSFDSDSIEAQGQRAAAADAVGFAENE